MPRRALANQYMDRVLQKPLYWTGANHLAAAVADVPELYSANREDAIDRELNRALKWGQYQKQMAGLQGGGKKASPIKASEIRRQAEAHARLELGDRPDLLNYVMSGGDIEQYDKAVADWDARASNLAQHMASTGDLRFNPGRVFSDAAPGMPVPTGLGGEGDQFRTAADSNRAAASLPVIDQAVSDASGAIDAAGGLNLMDVPDMAGGGGPAVDPAMATAAAPERAGNELAPWAVLDKGNQRLMEVYGDQATGFPRGTGAPAVAPGGDPGLGWGSYGADPMTQVGRGPSQSAYLRQEPDAGTVREVPEQTRQRAADALNLRNAGLELPEIQAVDDIVGRLPETAREPIRRMFTKSAQGPEWARAIASGDRTQATAALRQIRDVSPGLAMFVAQALQERLENAR